MKKIISLILAFIFLAICIALRFFSFDTINNFVISKISNDIKFRSQPKFYFNILTFNLFTDEEVLIEKNYIKIKASEFKINPIINNIKMQKFQIDISGKDQHDSKEKLFIIEELKNIIKNNHYNLFFKDGNFLDFTIDKLEILNEKMPKIIFYGRIDTQLVAAQIIFNRNQTGEYFVNEFNVDSQNIRSTYRRSSEEDHSLSLSLHNIQQILKYNFIPKELTSEPIFLDINITSKDKSYLNGRITFGNNSANSFDVNAELFNNNNLNIKIENKAAVSIGAEQITKDGEIMQNISQDSNINLATYIDDIYSYIQTRYNLNLEVNLEKITVGQKKINIEGELDLLNQNISIPFLKLEITDILTLDVKDNFFNFNLLDLNNVASGTFTKLNSSVKQIKGEGEMHSEDGELSLKDTSMHFLQSENKTADCKINKVNFNTLDTFCSNVNLGDILSFSDTIYNDKISIIELIDSEQRSLDFKKINLNFENILINQIAVKKLSLKREDLSSDSIMASIFIDSEFARGNITFNTAVERKTISTDAKINTSGIIEALDIKATIDLLNDAECKSILFPSLRNIDIYGDWLIKEFTYSNIFKGKNLALNIKGRNGAYEINSGNESQDATLNMILNLSSSPKIEIGFLLNGLNFKEASSSCSTEDSNITGTMYVNGKMYAYGNNIRSIVDNTSSSGNMILAAVKIHNLDLVSLAYKMLYRNDIDLNNTLRVNKGIIENMNGKYKYERGSLSGNMNFNQELVSGQVLYNVNILERKIEKVDGSFVIATKDRFSKNQINMNIPFKINGQCDINDGISSEISFKEVSDYISKIHNK